MQKIILWLSMLTMLGCLALAQPAPDSVAAGIVEVTGLSPETITTILTVVAGPILWGLVEWIKRKSAIDIPPKQTTALVALLGAAAAFGLCELTHTTWELNDLFLQGMAIVGTAATMNGATK